MLLKYNCLLEHTLILESMVNESHRAEFARLAAEAFDIWGQMFKSQSWRSWRVLDRAIKKMHAPDNLFCRVFIKPVTLTNALFIRLGEEMLAFLESRS